MKSYIMIIATLVLAAGLSGCGAIQRQFAVISGSANVCVEGVSYLQFPSGVTVQYTRDGKIKNC